MAYKKKTDSLKMSTVKNPTFTFDFTCVDPLYCLLDNNNRSRAALTTSRAPGKSNALGPIPTQPLIGIKL